MLYKGVLIAIVIFCSSGVGKLLLEQKRERVYHLQGVLQSCERIAQYMHLQNYTLLQAVAAAGEEEILFSQLKRQFAGQTEITVKKTQQFFKQAGLQDAVAEKALSVFFCALSAALTGEQILAAWKQLYEPMTAHLQTLQKTQQEQEKVIRALSVSVGLTIAVILL